jgi:4-amino-4-deoxy-L-arabinose transferase-like glycosyltransferase
VTASRERALVAAGTLLLLAPFAGAAFAIDAPVFLAVARRIVAAPLDPFGFQMAWDATALDVARFNLNPPLFSYWLAPWLAAFGAREPWMHVAAWPFALLGALAFHGIAREAGVGALRATALLVATPAFLVLATTLQVDVPVEALFLAAVLALLRARATGSTRWEWCAGVAAAAAGLTKYVGLAALPLLAAGLVMLPGPRPAQGAWLRVVGVPAAAYAAWGAFTKWQYGFVHYAAGATLVGDRSVAPLELANHAASLPIWYGGALVFPLFVFASRLWRADRGLELALLSAAAGAAVAALLLPIGEPLRRVPLQVGEGVFAALCFAAAVLTLGLAFARGREHYRDPLDRFLVLWAGGFVVFSLAINWHVNAADALIVAPPLLLLLLRDARTCPSPRAQWSFAAASLALSLGLAHADALQADVYREAAGDLDAAIGDAPGARWQVGQWGFQHYVEPRGFQPLLPETPLTPGSPLAAGDWLASARNVSQLDVAASMRRYDLRSVRSFVYESAFPLRTTNPDAGAGFYSHHGGYVPYAWSAAPLDTIGLGRIVAGPDDRGRSAP